jgi:hypothetical protein
MAMSMLKKLTDYAKSPEARAEAQKLADKAKAFANDPKRREELEAIKRKFAQKRDGHDGGPKTAA